MEAGMADEFGRTSTDDAGTGGLQDDGVLRTSDGVRHEGLQGKAEQLQHAARESGRDLLDQAVEKKDELKARASTALDDGRHQVSDRVSSVARALHSTAENLEQDGDRQMSQWVHQAADQVDRVVGYLNGRNAGGLMHDMEDLARRNPALFLGGTYAAGLALGRFLRASSPERRTSADDEHAPEPGTGYGAETPAGGSPWTGVGVSRDSFGADPASGAGFGSGDTVRDGFGASPATSGLGGGHTSGGHTDESLREGESLGSGRSYGAASSLDDAGEHDLDTGELTRYTNGDRSREV
jgi:hypothetical protein